MVGSDDVLACFIAGNAFTWDDWFRQETEDDSLQPTIDMLLNVAVFMWYGAVCPWHKFVANDVVPIYRLIPLGIMVLLFRRLPMMLLYHYLGLIHQVEELKHAFFVGFFGPIGVSAIFYLYISREFLAKITVGNHERVDAHHLAECIDVVVWFLVICSVTVHGLSVPLGKLGFYLPRTISTAVSTERLSISQSMARSPSTDHRSSAREMDEERQQHLPRFRRRLTSSERGPAAPSTSIHWLPRSLVRAGKHIYEDIKSPRDHHSHVANDKGDEDNGNGSGSGNGNASEDSGKGGGNGGAHPNISLPSNPRPLGHVISNTSNENDDMQKEEGLAGRSGRQSAVGSGANTPSRQLRSVQFADDAGARIAISATPRGQSPEDGERKPSGHSSA